MARGLKARLSPRRVIALIIVLLCCRSLYFQFFASPFEEPVVQLNQGVIRGQRVVLMRDVSGSTKARTYYQDNFFGIPYAQPPVGKLRYHRPQPLLHTPRQDVDATRFGKACMQPLNLSRLYPPLKRHEISEDCLNLNIIRPHGVKANAKLPVLVWMYGGSFKTGYTSIYDSSALVAQSAASKQHVIFVSMNYRINSFGFLASPEVAIRARHGDASLNNGLHDQRLALRWIQKNIAHFGGDPSKVTIFGESAGAISVGAQLIANGGNHEGLFRGAILQSGAPSGWNVPSTDVYQASYERFAQLAGCGDVSAPARRKTRNTLDCLRILSSDDLLTATTKLTLEASAAGGSFSGLPFNIVQDSFFYATKPSNLVASGKIARVPIIAGTNLDEGTFLTPHSLATEIDLVTYIKRTYMPQSLASTPQATNGVRKLLRLYPDDPTLGSPFIQPRLSSSPRHQFHHAIPLPPAIDATRLFPPADTNQYRRAAAIIGDMVFESGRRAFLDAVVRNGEGDSEAPDAWAYHFRQPTDDAPSHLGVWHTSEIRYVMGEYTGNTPHAEVSRLMGAAWINFANNLDPNGPRVPKWPIYGPEKTMLKIRAGDEDVLIKDDFRAEAIAFLNSPEWNDLTAR